MDEHDADVFSHVGGGGGDEHQLTDIVVGGALLVGAQLLELVPGLSDIDRVISGLNKSDLIILAARPGVGKTSIALNMLLSAGKYSGKNVVFFSLEMSRVQLMEEMASKSSRFCRR